MSNQKELTFEEALELFSKVSPNNWKIDENQPRGIKGKLKELEIKVYEQGSCDRLNLSENIHDSEIFNKSYGYGEINYYRLLSIYTEIRCISANNRTNEDRIRKRRALEEARRMLNVEEEGK